MTTTNQRSQLTALYDVFLNPVLLGAPLGDGKEGTVHPTSSHHGWAAKVFHQQPVPDEMVAKLQYMVDNPPPVTTCSAYRITWPVSPIFRTKRNRNVVGYLMPQLDQDRYREIGAYLNPTRRRWRTEQRKRGYTFLHLLTMAQNLAHAVAHLHAQGHIVGDLNSRNVQADDRGRIALIDTDSFQILNRREGVWHRCPVGTPEYTSPGLQQASYTEQDRSLDDDRFALAVMIYQLLFQGQHPYSGQYQCHDGANLTTVAERISRATFVHGPQTRVRHQPNPAAAIIWKTSPLKTQFRTAFRRRGERTTADEWVEAIEQAAHNIVQCNRNDSHYQFANSKCAWCDYQKITGVDPFPKPR